MIIATLIKLFTTRIVASNLFGFSKSFCTSSDFLDLVCLSLFLSLGERLKNATSLAETIAERKSKKTTIIAPAINEFIETE